MMRWLNNLRNRQYRQAEIDTLISILNGDALRSHRDIDGNKYFYLHSLSGEKVSVNEIVVHLLRKKRLIETNHKFPSATFLLTDSGRRQAEEAAGHIGSSPIGASNFINNKR